jgi:hypothetical protein
MGPLPQHFLANSSILAFLHLEYNQFSSSIPSSLYYNPLFYFSASNNKLTGTIPDTIQLWKNRIFYLYLGSNRLHGTLSQALTRLSSCGSLDLSSNLFTGTLPTNLGDMTNLQNIILRNNSFHGSLPSSITKLAALSTFFIDWNFFTGTLHVLDNPSSLNYMYKFRIQNNLFTGPFFQSEMMQIADMNISTNLLTGQRQYCKEYEPAKLLGCFE